jgi:uncharacterized protein (TIGR00255 family)
MTGFARATFDFEGAKFSWELKSVNARGLEIRVRMPPGFDHLEAEVRTMIRDAVARGSCHAMLSAEVDLEGRQLVVNEQALALVVAAARRLAQQEGIAMPSADGLLAIPGVLQDGSGTLDAESAARRDSAILSALSRAIEDLMAARREEGGRLTAALDDQLRSVEEMIRAAGNVAAQAPEALRERIRNQVALLTSDPSMLNPDRLHQEAVVAATRADVREELDRLRSHVASARALIASGLPAGRKLEFLAQEFNREANTLCSKAFDQRLTTIGLELKAVIDQFREQAQNLA